MNWLMQQYANEKYNDALREAALERELNALRAQTAANAPAPKLRQSLGDKLIEWGKRLQENPIPAETLLPTKG